MKRTSDDGVGRRDERDPIVGGSLNWPMTIAALCLILATVWAAYDEFIGRRPWKALQAAFVPAYREHLQQVRDLQGEKEKVIEASDEYQQLKAAADGTVMPADLFKEGAGRWTARFLPEEPLRVKDADHLELMVRYQKFFDEDEAEYWRRRQESEK